MGGEQGGGQRSQGLVSALCLHGSGLGASVRGTCRLTDDLQGGHNRQHPLGAGILKASPLSGHNCSFTGAFCADPKAGQLGGFRG